MLADAFDGLDQFDRLPLLLFLDLLFVFLGLVLELLDNRVGHLFLAFVVEAQRETLLSVFSALLAERVLLLSLLLN